MKITLNFSPAASLRDRFALAWAIPATVVGIAALVFLVRASLREYRNYRGIKSQATEIQARVDELRDQEAAIHRKFEDPAYRHLLVEANFVNHLIDQRKFSVTEVSSRLAGLLPEDAELTGLSVMAPKTPGDDYSIRVGISAKGEDAIESFINDLEDSSDFKDVSIVNQGFEEDASQGGQINVMCTARYLPGAAEESEGPGPEAKAGGQAPQGASRATGSKGGKTAGKTQEAKPDTRKPRKGARPSRAEEPTPNHKSGH